MFSVDDMGHRIDDLEAQMAEKMKTVKKAEQEGQTGSSGPQ